ncbi:hypothetical protein C4J81_00850 [Deltaproteobacteria bacterium Smac51]|nr:hypothetical protein C4J81_00850 [Deltaproteobacteria bacterium Smac51]
MILEEIVRDDLIEISRRQPGGGNLYLLLDLAVEGHTSLLYADGGKSSWISLFLNTPYDDMVVKGPALVAINQNHHLWQWFLDKDPGLGGALLISPDGLKEVSEYFKHFLNIRLFSSQRVVYFRFYDPRNLSVFLGSLTEQEAGVFLGPLSHLIWPENSIDKSRRWRAVEHKPLPSTHQAPSPWPESQATAAALIARSESLQPEKILQELSAERTLAERFRILGPSASLNFIQEAIARAKSQGLTRHRHLSKWAAFMLKYGGRFETDPQYSWSSIHPRNETPPEKLERLEAMIKEYESVSLYGQGLESENIGCPAIFGRSWRRLWLIRFDDLKWLDSPARLLTAMERIYPERFAAGDPDGLKLLVERAFQAAAVHDLSAAEGAAMLAMVMWLCGWESWRGDPALPWLNGLLARCDRELPPSGRAEWLYGRLRRRLARPYHRFQPYFRGARERRMRLAFRAMSSRFRQHELSSIKNQPYTQAAENIIRQVGGDYLANMPAPLKNRCFDAAFREGRHSATAQRMSAVRPFLAALLFFHFNLGGVDPESMDHDGQPGEWIEISSVIGAGSAQLQLELLRKLFDELLKHHSSRSLFHPDVVCQDSVDSDIFLDLRQTD